MSKLKSEKYKGWTIKFKKLGETVFTEIQKGSKVYGAPTDWTKKGALELAKKYIDSLESKKKINYMEAR